METILLEVKTPELTVALKRLCKLEKRVHYIYLKYSDGLLLLSIGGTQEEVSAHGSWPAWVRVPRKWGETVSQHPNEVAVTTLRISEEKIWVRDFGTNCLIGHDPTHDENAEEILRRQGDIAAAVESLSRYHVTVNEIETLMQEADREKAAIWSPGDGKVAEDIIRAWSRLFTYGVEPSDVRRLLHKKSRGLWKNAPARDK